VLACVRRRASRAARRGPSVRMARQLLGTLPGPGDDR
jgi:hypothetical protein